MKQTRRDSVLEAIANTAVGYLVAVLTQLAVLPHFGLGVTVPDSMAIGAIFTVVSILRSYVLRRAFEALRLRRRHAG